MAPSQVFSQTLRSITRTKFNQLARQKVAYESAKTSLLRDADDEPSPKRAKILVDGATKLSATSSLSQPTVETLQRFLLQAENDPSVSQEAIESYEHDLRNELDTCSEKHRFAELYAKLIDEWISTSESDSSHLHVPRTESQEQRAVWEQYVFCAKEVDEDAIKTYLGNLFQSEASSHVKKAYNDFVESIKSFQKTWDLETHFDEDSLQHCIQGLLRTNLLNDEKRMTLNDFLGNKVVLREIADVLNMRMRTRATWEWDNDCIVEPRRHLNGRYRFFPDEDLLQSLFLYYIGRRWCVMLRQAAETFCKQRQVMKPAFPALSKEEARRRQHFLGSTEGKTATYSLSNLLNEHFDHEIFIDQLPREVEEQRGSYGDDKASVDDNRKSPIAVVQKLLQTLQTHIIVQNKLGHEITVIRSDFKWFGPSLPHASIFAVLEFLGVQPDWINFFRQVLECPLRFEDDSPDTPSRTRKRGIPLSTPLADFFSESVLFCLDFDVNRRADGARLYRLHDDMWLWNSAETCAEAWRVINEFTDLFGLELNEEKTGSTTIHPSGCRDQIDEAISLPSGDVAWGFLKLDTTAGRFVIDQTKVEEHIDELRIQLDGCKSTLDWIRAWNTYGCRFFTTNFGSFARCYSRAHVDTILSTFRHIQQALFPSLRGGVGARLKEILADRFGITDVPDGFLYTPVALGGLGLHNPFATPYVYRDGMPEDAGAKMDKFLEEEKLDYDVAKRAFESSDEQCDDLGYNEQPYPYFMDVDGDNAFFSFEEYTQHRERTSAKLRTAFQDISEEPLPKPLEPPKVLSGLLPEDWDDMAPYDQWVCLQHSKETVARFGGLAILEKGLLPTGVIEMLQQSRFQWQD
ncbi:uncharacterized protein NECHADRAFT_55652 [Fusarium vanettenii 77-13-4]|uniref:Reverse transcriptase domain-containing protein n=1 Tax=Fusarium vanettenii (strain ATCC MYA-4622 / CBS 123669 / FGSC 9596 / NRRL 45880 / 77-13-4) TaxID=660122 RepID=C7ZAR9_FUSV7|nr:uncharacterized protein NECHADRAFT_55652 [Fusarium vanettenii 77-13-4]EEU38893.1 hypothetical protein NECHADRAFT_55652 [Fusarium vanettenii 77-13-4]